MIAHGYEYKWVELDSALSITNKYVLQTETKKSTLRTDFQDQAFAHATRSSQTFWSWRQFDLSWIAWGSRVEAQSAMDAINQIIQPEYFPAENNRWFYELSWYDHSCNRRFKVQAKVVDSITYDHEAMQMRVNFSFSLYAETHWYYWYIDKQVVWETSLLGWLQMVNKFVTPPVWWGWTWLLVNNEWNFATPINISCSDELVNPIFYNNRTWYFYRLEGTFNNLSITFDPENFNYDILDWTTRVAYLSTDQSIEWAFRAVPWVNYITVTSDNYILWWPNPIITINYNDAFDSN